MRYKIVLMLFSLLIAAFIIPHSRMAFSIGTGLGLAPLQKKIEMVQSRAINNEITSDDKHFLRTFYRVLAYGAAATFVLPESSRLMHHYLDGTGEQTIINQKLFLDSDRVIAQMKRIRNQLIERCELGYQIESPVFDMGHIRPLDAHFALYFGTISGKLVNRSNQRLEVFWSTDMPWKWPTYEKIKKLHGTFYAEIIPFPNLLSLMGYGPPMFLPNALGGELEKQGLAKSFDIKTDWYEKIDC